MDFSKILSSPLFSEDNIYGFIYKMTKKYIIECNHHKSVNLQEDEAVKLCDLLRKFGFFDVNTKNGCAICALENLEKRIMQQLQHQIDAIKKARSYYMQPENLKNYRMCGKHLPPQQHSAQSNPVNQEPIIPSTSAAGAPLHGPHPPPFMHQVPPQPPIVYVPDNVPVMPVVHTLPGGPHFTYDCHIPIPAGVDPVAYMASYNERMRYLQQIHAANYYKRMPYTNSFQMEMTEERRAIGRKYFQ